MTSISSNSAAMSPADRLQYALQAAVQAGTVNASDQTALSTALTNIDSSLQSAAATPNTTNLDPGSIKDQVNSLINGQVSNGTLTPDQGNELQQVLAQAAHKMGGGHHRHMPVDGGSGGEGSTDQSNPIDSLFADLTTALDSVFGTNGTTGTGTTDPTATADASSNSASGSSITTTASNSASATSPADTLTASIDQLIGFLKQIEQKAVSGYTASGATTGNVANDALLVNGTA